MNIKAIRTADERFEGLPDFNYAPHYMDDLPGYEALRVHYLDDGQCAADRVFLCLHFQVPFGSGSEKQFTYPPNSPFCGYKWILHSKFCLK